MQVGYTPLGSSGPQTLGDVAQSPEDSQALALAIDGWLSDYWPDVVGGGPHFASCFWWCWQGWIIEPTLTVFGVSPCRHAGTRAKGC